MSLEAQTNQGLANGSRIKASSYGEVVEGVARWSLVLQMIYPLESSMALNSERL